MKPILFNSEMVQAILDGRKCCTRRVVKFPVNRYTNNVPLADKIVLQELRCDKANFLEEPFFSFGMNLPYQPGDIIYVRETWKKAPNGYYYYEDWQRNDIADVTKWKPSIHMPKEAARIWLKVTNVRVERLQDMTDDDAEAEGCFDYTSTALGFPDVWDSTIKKSDLDRYGWDANPWVWVIEFERCDKLESEE